MNEAIKLALKGSIYTHPNPKVGCIIVKNNQIIGKGYHRYFGGDHAEVNAVKYCLKKFKKDKGLKLLKGSTAYITLEPCSISSKTPPCTETIIKYGIKKIFCASLDPNKSINGRGVKILRKNNVDVKVGLLKNEAKSINEEFFFRHTKGRPFVRMKIAQTLDGKIALNSGESKWITSKDSREDVQYLRAESDAILVGSGTVKKDNPRLNVRNIKINKDKYRQPKKIILGNVNTKSNLSILKGDSEKIIFSNNPSSTKDSKIKYRKLSNSKTIELLLKELPEFEINSLLVEGGSEVFSSFINKNMVDELIIYISPKILGKNAISSLNIKSPKILKNATNFKIIETVPMKEDIKIIMRRI
jgi:diaminohydroxyphosphoribosylaminopyrimidine deaminase/5-amino-6-(5-phosphoribosylamino)uracil reductase